MNEAYRISSNNSRPRFNRPPLAMKFFFKKNSLSRVISPTQPLSPYLLFLLSQKLNSFKNTGFVTVLCNANVHVFTSPIIPLILTFGKLIKEPNLIGTLKKPLFSLFDLHYYFF